MFVWFHGATGTFQMSLQSKRCKGEEDVRGASPSTREIPVAAGVVLVEQLRST